VEEERGGIGSLTGWAASMAAPPGPPSLAAGTHTCAGLAPPQPDS
jgi:hypothetical protein